MPGGDDRDPARLAPVGGDLGHDLRGRDAERAREARRGAHRRLHGLGDRTGAGEVGGEPGEVEVALVEPGALDERHDLAHGGPHRLRVLAVERVPGPHEDRLRAAAQCLGAAHRRVDPEPRARRSSRSRRRLGPCGSPPTTSGFRRSSGCSSSSTAAKNASRSRCARIAMMQSMIGAPALSTPAPAIVSPAPREVSFGLVAGTAPSGTRRVIVRVGKRALPHKPLRGTVLATRPPALRRHRASRSRPWTREAPLDCSSAPVFGLPRSPSRRPDAPSSITALARTVRSLARGPAARAPSTSRICAPDEAPPGTREPASRRLDAEARDRGDRAALARRHARRGLERRRPPATRCSSSRTTPRRTRSRSGSRARRRRLGAGQRDHARARARRLEMYGGYEIERASAAADPDPDREPAGFGLGKYTTAWDLARLARASISRPAARDRFRGSGFTPPEARYLLWLLAHVADRGKLDRYLGRPRSVLHKAGWNTTSATTRHRLLAGRGLRRRGHDLESRRSRSVLRAGLRSRLSRGSPASRKRQRGPATLPIARPS